MRLSKLKKLTKSEYCPFLKLFHFTSSSLASCVSKGLNAFIIFSVVLIIVFWCPVKSFALNPPSSPASTILYSSLLTRCNDEKISRIEIQYSEPFSNCGFDVNYMVILIPNDLTWTDSNHDSVFGGAWPSIINRSSSSNQNKDYYNPVVQLFSSNDLFVSYSSNNKLDSSLAILKLNNISNSFYGLTDGYTLTPNIDLCSSQSSNMIYVGYNNSDNQNFKLMQGYHIKTGYSTSNSNIFRSSAYDIPFYSWQEFNDTTPSAWIKSDGVYYVLGNSYEIFHNVESISFISGNGSDSFDDSGVQEECSCQCQNCCQCDCGYYTEELKEELVSYFETNMVTREMFEEFVENNTYVQNYYESQQEEISSIKDNTEFSSEVDDYYDNADNMFSDINNALDGLDDFDDQLTIGSEIQGAGTIINSMFSNFPPAVIVAMVFVLVMLVVVKIIGR